MLIVLIFNNFKGDSLLEDGIVYLDDDNSDFSVSNATNEESIDIKVVSAEIYFHKPMTVHLELYLFYCFIHFLLYIGQY